MKSFVQDNHLVFASSYVNMYTVTVFLSLHKTTVKYNMMICNHNDSESNPVRAQVIINYLVINTVVLKHKSHGQFLLAEAELSNYIYETSDSF